MMTKSAIDLFFTVQVKIKDSNLNVHWSICVHGGYQILIDFSDDLHLEV